MFHIWILGLKDGYRGNNLEIELKAQKLKFSIFWGINGSKRKEINQIPNYTSNFSNFLYGRDMLSTEVATSLGHIGIYGEFLKSNYEWALILEDDVRIDSGLSYFLECLTKYKEPAVISLSSGEGFKFKKHTFLHERFKVKNHEILRLLELPSLAHGYLINRRAVEMIDLKESKRLISVADWPYLWPKSFQYYMAKVSLVEEDDSNFGTLIGDRKSLAANPPSFWLPSIRRSITAYKFGVNLQLAFYNSCLNIGFY